MCPFSGGKAAGINTKLTDILHVCLNTGYAVPFIECRVIQHLKVVQFSILIQKLLFRFNVMEAYTTLAISAVERDFQHILVLSDDFSTVALTLLWANTGFSFPLPNGSKISNCLIKF